MPAIAIWLFVILLGIMALGVAESARSGRLAGVRWEVVKTMAMGAAIILLTVIAGVLVVVWTVVVLLVEIWQPLLIAVGVVIGSFAMLITYPRHRSLFYFSTLATIAVLLLYLL